jgi:hypothetical protein
MREMSAAPMTLASRIRSHVVPGDAIIAGGPSS